MDLNRGAGLKLDAGQIPETLRALIHWVEKWAFESLSEQDEFVAEMRRRRPDEVQEFNRLVDEHRASIASWGATLSHLDKHISELTDDDWRHPYWSFLNAVKVREITGFDGYEPEVLAAKSRVAQEIRTEQYNKATADADEAFRQRDYAAYLSILSPFEDLHSPAQKKKIALAVRKVEEAK